MGEHLLAHIDTYMVSGIQGVTRFSPILMSWHGAALQHPML